MKKCLIVVDFQNDFIDGSLGFNGAINIKDKIIEKINIYRKNNDEVIFTMDTHYPDYLDGEEGKNLPVEHCIKGTKGHQIQKDVFTLKQPDDMVFEKPTFPSLELGTYLKEKNFSEVELCGLVSNICVLSNAVIAKSALPNAHIIVDALATDSYDKDLHTKGLDIMNGLHIEVLNR
jgi:nicotinamidase/pyrazinamidase